MEIQSRIPDRSHINALTAYLSSKGRNGDTILAHIGPAEANLLTKLGGSNTVNPKTGLREFWEDGGGAGNSAGSNSGNQGGQSGNGGNGSGNSGGNGRGPISGGDTRADPGNVGGGYGPAGSAVGGYSGEGRGWSGSQTTGGNLAPGDTRAGQSAFSSAQDAYHNSILAHVFGAVPDLANSATYAQGDWHTGFNPIGTAAGLVAGAFAPPGVGSLVGYGAGELARAMGVGDVVLGGPGAPATESMYKGTGTGAQQGFDGSTIGQNNGPALGPSGSNGGNPGAARLAALFHQMIQEHGRRVG